MLPKLHKEGMPGRPVVSSVSSPTEKSSAFLDEFLRPMAQNLPSTMGTRAAPNFANVFMGYFENRFVYHSRWFKRFIKSWWRYINDIFMLWKGPRKPLEDFLNYLNEVHPSIKFEWKISKHKASFLDCDEIKENNKLKTDVC